MSSAVLSLGLPPEGAGMALFRAGRTPWASTLDRAAVDALATEFLALLAPVEGVIVPGQDAALVRREHALARHLAALLERDAVGQGLASLAHAAAEGGRRLTLLLDLRDEALRRLPWELLEGLAPAEAGVAPCRIVRLADAPGPAVEPSRAGGVEVAVGRLDPTDPLCRRVAASTLEALSRLPGVRGHALEGPPAGAGGTSGLRVLHLVSHGRVDDAQVRVALGGDRHLDPGAAARWVDPLATGLDLAVLDVCSGGTWEGSPGSGPAERLVREGLPAAIAPSLPVDPTASLRFSTALYGSLAAGRTLAEAVDAGRRSLAGLGIAHPSCRPWVPVLVVRDADAVALCSAAGGPSAWAPKAGPDLLALLGRAVELSGVHGFLGVEHLALVLSRWERPSPRLAFALSALTAIGERINAWHPGQNPGQTPTPRAAALLAALPPGAGPDELLDALAAVPWVGAALPVAAMGARSAETMTDARPESPAPAGRARALRLEVLGGPEDGRRLRWTPGTPILGRWDPLRTGPEAVELFVGGGAFDPAVSRRHLELGPDGRVRALGSAWVERARSPEPLQEATSPAPGDVFMIGAATRLLVLSVETEPPGP